MRWLLLLAALCLTGCERAQIDPTEEVEQLAPGVADQVVADLLIRMKTYYAETTGARIANELPRLKDETARAAEFPDWERFLARVRKTEPGREVEISRQITAQLRELLKPREEEKPDD